MRLPRNSLSVLSWNIVILWIQNRGYRGIFTEHFWWYTVHSGWMTFIIYQCILCLSVTVCLVLCGLCGTLGWRFRLTGLNPATCISLFQKCYKKMTLWVINLGFKLLSSCGHVFYWPASFEYSSWYRQPGQGFYPCRGYYQPTLRYQPSHLTRESYETQTRSVWHSIAEQKEVQEDYMGWKKKKRKRKKTQSGM